MNHPAARHAGNLVAVFGLLVLALAGLDHLMVWLGWPPTFGCWLRPVVMLGQAVALAVVSIGLLLALVRWTRSAGITLIVAGMIVATLPSVLADHLGVFCARL